MQYIKITKNQLGIRQTKSGCYQIRIGLRDNENKCLSYMSFGLGTDNQDVAKHIAMSVLRALRIAGYTFKKSQEYAVDLIEENNKNYEHE